MLLQFRGLRAFCVAAERLSFKQTAAELCLTASAVSHQIRDLEDHLGVKLFERRTRAIALTDAGLALFHEVHPHLRAIERAARRVREGAGARPAVVARSQLSSSPLAAVTAPGWHAEEARRQMLR